MTTFSVPLTIDDYTKSATVKENEDVTLKCKSNGIPDAQVHWYFENSRIGKILQTIYY